MQRIAYRRARRGIALMLVLVIVGMATVMGFGMLSSNAMRVQVANNIAAMAQAELLNDSALELAAYYLQYPDRAPSLNEDGYWPGGENITLASELNGTVDIEIVQSSPNVYDVFINATAGVGEGVSRSSSGRLHTNLTTVKHGAVFGGDITVPTGMTIRGGIYSTHKVIVSALAVIEGTILSTSIVGNLLDWLPLPDDAPSRAPEMTAIRSYDTYDFAGNTYSAAKLSTNTLNSTVLGPTETNPAGIYWIDQHLTLRNNVAVNGTLIIKDNRKLIVRGAGSHITPVKGFPALVVTDKISVEQLLSSLTVNGLVWTGKGIDWSGASLLSSITINGALIVPAAGELKGGLTQTTVVNYEQSKVKSLDLVSGDTYPRSVKMVYWNRFDN